MKTQIFNSDELAFYSRHFSLPGVGIDGQKKLKNAKVLCIGVGGLGSPLLLYLAAAGVGQLGLIDDDRVEKSNLHRQVLFDYNDIGEYKAEAGKRRIQALNPNIILKSYSERLTVDNVLAIVQNYDVVVDCTDNFATRYLVNDACMHLSKPYVYSSIFQFEGQLTVFSPNGPCYRCLYPEAPPPSLMPNCAEAGVFGVLPGVMGSIQAVETIKCLLDIGDNLIGRLLLFDALKMSFRELSIKKNPNCLICAHRKSFDELDRVSVSCQIPEKSNDAVDQMTVHDLKQLMDRKETVVLLDVREAFEYDICHLNGKLIPLMQLSHRLSELDPSEEIIVYCKSGVRSQKASLFLKENGFTKVKNLKGGIIEWIEKIDPSLEKY